MISRYPMDRYCFIATFCCTLALSACVSVPQPDYVVPPERSSSPVFDVEGRFAVRSAEQGGHGRFHWSHTPDQNVFEIISPLGATLGKLTWNSGAAQSVLSDGKEVIAQTPEALSQELLGVEVPIRRFSQWIQATPDNNAQILERDNQGRPIRMSDAGWVINYATYTDEQAQARPKSLQAQRGEVSLKLLIDQWNVPPL